MEENKMPVTAQAAIINAALSKVSFSVQKVQDAINGLVYNADHLPDMKKILKSIAEMEKVVDDTHKVGKAPALTECRAWDDGKKGILAVLETLRSQVKGHHDRISKEEDDKRIAAENEVKRKKDIAIAIEQTVINFSTLIADCDSNDKLLAVERNINLEKSPGRKGKYMEFHEKAIERFNEVLLPILKVQKEKVKQKEELEKQLAEAENNDDLAKIDDLREKQEQIENEIRQNQVDVQINASKQESLIEEDTAQEIFQDVNPVNRVKFEIVDLKAVVKNCPELLDYSLKFRETQKIAMALKDAGTFDGKSEVIVNGIKFFIDKSFKA